MTRIILPSDHKFKTEPFLHQLAAFEHSRSEEYFALLMEQGTGKTKVIIDTAAWLYGRGEINSLVVLAPNGVHRNWISDEIPIHMPDGVDWLGHIWRAGDLNRKKSKDAINEMMRFDGLSVLALNIEAVRTEAGAKVIESFLTARPSLFVIDESTIIKTPGAAQTIKVIGKGKSRGLAGKAKYRRILTGTPITQGPFDLFSQFKFLDPEVLGFQSYYSFKHHYGEFIMNRDYKNGHQYETLTDYKNSDELQKSIAPFSYRVTKEECLDLPPKIYQKRYYPLSNAQRKAYNSLRDEFIAELDSGETINAALAIVRLIRLQQICSNFIGSDAGQIEVSDSNPRLDLLKEIVEPAKKVIVWARFRRDISAIHEMLGGVRYDGATSADDRADAIDRFQNDPSCKYFIGNPSAAGLGITLHAADLVVYYSNSFKLEERLQSEDRAHRIGLNHSVVYVDIIAEETIDEHIAGSLQAKINIADSIIGESFRRLLL